MYPHLLGQQGRSDEERVSIVLQDLSSLLIEQTLENQHPFNQEHSFILQASCRNILQACSTITAEIATTSVAMAAIKLQFDLDYNVEPRAVPVAP